MALAILYQGQPEGKTHTQGCEVRRREGTRVPARNGGALVCCSWLTPAVDLLLGEITKALIISATLECWWLGHADLCILNKMPFSIVIHAQLPQRDLSPCSRQSVCTLKCERPCPDGCTFHSTSLAEEGFGFDTNGLRFHRRQSNRGWVCRLAHAHLRGAEESG